MKILVLGGTIFLGRHLVDAALARDHEVTLFNRGQHHPDLYPDLEKLRGDRDGVLQVLEGREWDAVFDPSGYVPRLVSASARLLASAVQHYTFISSISVYRDFKLPGLDEAYPAATIEDETSEDVTQHYGPLKALSERAAEAAMPGRVLHVRAGLIVGPHDPTNRFTYWPARLARGGEVLAPGRPDRAVQIIDARDLAEWIVRMAEERRAGVFNATGPESRLTMAEVLDACHHEAGTDAQLTWVDERFLLENGVQPWMELPLWVPSTPDYAGFAAVDCRKAFRAGLVFRPLAGTIADTLAWDGTLPPEHERRAGMEPEREVQLLRRWHEQTHE